jgi:hypothetical protein
MADFVEVLEETELDNEIAEKTDDDEIIVNIFYESSERDQLFVLSSWIAKNIDDEDKE